MSDHFFAFDEFNSDLDSSLVFESSVESPVLHSNFQNIIYEDEKKSKIQSCSSHIDLQLSSFINTKKKNLLS